MNPASGTHVPYEITGDASARPRYTNHARAGSADAAMNTASPNFLFVIRYTAYPAMISTAVSRVSAAQASRIAIFQIETLPTYSANPATNAASAISTVIRSIETIAAGVSTNASPQAGASPARDAIK